MRPPLTTRPAGTFLLTLVVHACAATAARAQVRVVEPVAATLQGFAAGPTSVVANVLAPGAFAPRFLPAVALAAPALTAAPLAASALTPAPAALPPAPVPVVAAAAPVPVSQRDAASSPADAAQDGSAQDAAEAALFDGATTRSGGSTPLLSRIAALVSRAGAGGSSVPRATYAAVQRDPRAFQVLTGNTRERVRRFAENGRLRLVEIGPGEKGTLRELPVDLVPGRYYVAAKDGRKLVLTDYPLRHGGHRKLTNELGLPAPRKLEVEGTTVGGVIFYDDGVVVSGQALRYPSDRNADGLARALEDMGFRVLRRHAGPASGPNSSPTQEFDMRNMPLGI